MTTLPPGDATETTQPPTQGKEKLTKVPLWIPLTAFVGTSLALAVPLLFLRRRGRTARISLKDANAAPPPRRAQPGASVPPPSVPPIVSSSEPIVNSLRTEIETPSVGEMMSALSRMNSTSAIMAAKAFGIATALVAVGGAGLAWTVRTTMDVHNVHEFAHKMRYFMWKSVPSLTSRIYRAPETEEERRQLNHIAPMGTEWTWEKAQVRLQKAYDEGGFTLWGQMAIREMEAEAQLERGKREKEYGKA